MTDRDLARFFDWLIAVAFIGTFTVGLVVGVAVGWML